MEQFRQHPLYRKHTIDTAMNSIWEFYKNNFLQLFIISFVMALAIQYAASMIDMKELQTITDPMELLEKMKDYVVPFGIISLLNLLFTTILQHYIVNNPLNHEKIWVSAFKSLKYFAPYLIIMILVAFFGAIAIIMGLLALIIGVFFTGLYVMTLYLFILPVMMVEETGIGDTISRTFNLAHRNFWSNFGWVAVFFIILIVISVLFSAIIMIPFAGDFLKNILNPENAVAMDFTKSPVYIILSALVSALTLPIMPIFALVLYFNARAGEVETQQLIEEKREDRLRVEDLYAKPYSDDHPDNPDRKE